MGGEYWLSEPFTRAQAWIDLLLLANHRAGNVCKRGITFEVKRGQVGYSEEALAKRWQWSRGKVRRFLFELENDDSIERNPAIQTVQKTVQQNGQQTVQQNKRLSSLISIINYEQYQSSGTTDGTTKRPENGTMNKKLKNIFLSDSQEIRLSELLFSLILKNNPKARKANFQTWAKHIDRLHRIDQQSYEDIEKVIRWTQNDTFWLKNILSTENLRKQFDRLWLAMGNKPEPVKEYVE